MYISFALSKQKAFVNNINKLKVGREVGHVRVNTDDIMSMR